jgi:hypothetical protein
MKMNNKKQFEYISLMFLPCIYFFLKLTLPLLYIAFSIITGDSSIERLSIGNVFMYLMLISLNVALYFWIWYMSPNNQKKRRALTKELLAEPSDNPQVYDRRDYIPYHERTWREQFVDLFARSGRSNPTRLDDLIRRVEHMWGLNEEQMIANADPQIVKLLIDILERRKDNTTKYIGDLVYQFVRERRLAKHPFEVEINMILEGDEIFLEIRSGGCRNLSKEEYNRVGVSLTKELLLAVLTFARIIGNENHKYNLLEFYYVKEHSTGRRFSWHEDRPLLQFGFKNTPLIIVL